MERLKAELDHSNHSNHSNPNSYCEIVSRPLHSSELNSSSDDNYFQRENDRLTRENSALKLEIDQLKKMVCRDQLTGLYSRFFVEEELKRFDSRADYLYSVIFCDLNNLKDTNDTQGHQAGDALIFKTAKTIQRACRSTDIVSRLNSGGDEFMIVLPETNFSIASTIKDRINKFCLAENISLAMGVAQRDSQKSKNYQEVIAEADSAMYQQKEKMKSDTLSNNKN